MKKLLALIKNEYIKLFKHKSTTILIVLALLLVFAIPALSYWTSSSYSDSMSSRYEHSLQFTKDQLEEYKTPPSTNAPEQLANYYFHKARLERDIVVYQAAVEKNVSSHYDWRVEYINAAEQMSYDIAYLEVSKEHPELTQYLFHQPTPGSSDVKLTQLINKIKNGTFAEHLEENLGNLKSSVEAVKQQLRIAENELDSGKKPSDANIDPKQEIVRTKGQLYALEKHLALTELFISKNPKENNLAEKTFNETVMVINNLNGAYSNFQSENEYNPYNGIPYDVYHSETEKMITRYTEEIEIGMYALEHDVAEMTVAASSRAQSLSVFSTYWFMVPLLIFLASGLVSNEFSTKSINLLVMKPVKRWKILFSKYFTIISLSAIVLIATNLVYMLSIGVFYGFADFAEPALQYAFGAVVEVDFTLWLLGKAMMAAIAPLFLVTLSFMISTIVRNTAVSIILSVIALLSPIFTGLFLPARFQALATYLPMPYFNMWSDVFNETRSLVRFSWPMFNFRLDYTYGIFMLLGLTVIAVIASFVSFIKSDVK